MDSYPLDHMRAEGLFAEWGQPIRRVDVPAYRRANLSSLLTRNPHTGKLEQLKPKRLHIFYRDEEVTWRCRMADARIPAVSLLVPDETRAPMKNGRRPWKLNHFRTDAEAVFLHGPVRIEYDWPDE